MEKPTRVVAACRAHSGWAALVGLSGDPAHPELVARQRLELADPEDRTAKQPYHAAEELALGAARRFLERLRRDAATRADRALVALGRELGSRGRRLSRLGILQASGRMGADLEATLRSHALIHTADGEHFRDALAEAGAGLGLEVVRVPERRLSRFASLALGVSEAALTERVLRLGKPAGPPWGADQKAAALFAWSLLGDVRTALKILPAKGLSHSPS
jgi:hypothetical protein